MKHLLALIVLLLSISSASAKNEKPEISPSFLMDLIFLSDEYDQQVPMHYDFRLNPGIALHYKDIYDLDTRAIIDTTRKVYLGDAYGHFKSGDIDECYEAYAFHRRKVYWWNTPILRLVNSDSLSRGFNNEGVRLRGYGFFGFDAHYIFNHNNETRIDTTLLNRRDAHLLSIDSPEIRGIYLGGYLFYDQELKELRRLSGLYLGIHPPMIGRLTWQYAKGRDFIGSGNAYGLELKDASIRLSKIGSYNILAQGYLYDDGYRNCLGDSMANTLGLDYRSHLSLRDWQVDFSTYIHAERQLKYTASEDIVRWVVSRGDAEVGVRLGLKDNIYPEVYAIYEWMKLKNKRDENDISFEKYSSSGSIIACRFYNGDLMLRPLLKFYKPSLEELEGGFEADVSLATGLNLLTRVSFQNNLEGRDYHYSYVEARYQFKNWAVIKIGYGDEDFGSGRAMGEDISWLFLYDLPIQHKWYGQASFYF